MTKKQICEKYPAFAYFSGWNGIELHHIEYGIVDYIYCVSGAWRGKKRYHKCKVFTAPDGGLYIRVNGQYIDLNDCIRM